MARTTQSTFDLPVQHPAFQRKAGHDDVADLFCGAGGTSTGILRAADRLGRRINLLAINHWPTAVNTHSLNHPNVHHLCENLDRVVPRELVTSRRLRLLAASPECTHHSVAAGGKPKDDQSRATAWHICRWVADLDVDSILMENVKEFEDWGPLSARGKPLKNRKGETFKAFIQALRSMNYTVEWRRQVAADYGDPTSRVRLILMAKKGKGPIIWPEPTHGPGRAQPYRTAREIIDWDLKGRSIFNRERPLAGNTMRRIAAGLRKFGGVNAQPFLVMLYGTGETRSVDRPMPTVTAQGNHIGLCQPFVLGQQSCAAPRSVDQPLPTVATSGAIGLCEPCEPFIVKYYGSGENLESIHKPLATVTTRDRFLLIEPVSQRPVAELDIRYRMLQPHELAAAMSFPADYQFVGNREECVKQIGNAVPVCLAEAHAACLL